MSGRPSRSVRPIRCRCGKLQGEVDASASSAHGVCYCRDCRAFAYYLGPPEGMLDALGGTDVVAVQPRHVRFTQGTEHLACMSLTEKGYVTVVRRLLPHSYRQHASRHEDQQCRPGAFRTVRQQRRSCRIVRTGHDVHLRGERARSSPSQCEIQVPRRDRWRRRRACLPRASRESIGSTRSSTSKAERRAPSRSSSRPSSTLS